MKKESIFVLLCVCFIPVLLFAQPPVKKPAAPPVSEETKACLECHKLYTPGIVEDWLKSRHSKTPPSLALKKAEKTRRISAQKVAASLEKVVVGCYECHALNPEKHRDNFDHMGFNINVIVSPNDCSTCHNSLITTPDGKVVAERTHDFGSRLWVRLFGLIYSHPQPKHGDTSVLRNKDGLPLPTAFTGEVAKEGLIDAKDQEKRKKLMADVCNQCHGTAWVNSHFAKLDSTIKETDAMSLSATLLLLEAWKHGLAEGLPQGKNPFDESIEQMWIRQWLFYANSIKYASAMTGAPDYTTFKNGWWNLTENLQQMKDWIELKKKAKSKN